MKLRTVLAAILSPLAGGIVLTAFMYPDLFEIDLSELNTFNAVSGAIQAALMFSYFFAIALGSPAYLALWYFRRNSLFAYIVAGLCIGLIAYAIFYQINYAVYDDSRDDGYTRPFWHDELWEGVIAMCANFISYWFIASPKKRAA